jgi:UDP-N-acetylmuramyl pentapeptide synthase
MISRLLRQQKIENSEIGISRCILNEINEDHEYFICEMGAYNRGG